VVTGSKAEKAAERKQRLAAELRANLKKRKEQMRVRREPAEQEKPGDGGPAELAPSSSVR
jgi:hypothetical protein